MKLRSLKMSGEFDNYWKFHEQLEFIRNYVDEYAEPQFLMDDVS